MVIFQPGDKVTWEFTPPQAPHGLLSELSGRFVSLEGDKALVTIQAPDGIYYRKIDVDRLFIKVGWRV